MQYDKKTFTVELYSFYIYASKNFPEGREQFSFSYENGEAVLFGGVSTNKSNKIWKFDPNNFIWNDLDYECKTISTRFGHSAILYQSKLFIFGGKSKIQGVYMFQDLEIFDIDYKIWIFPTVTSSNFLKLRRNHVAILVGKFWFNSFLIFIYFYLIFP